jgi:3-(3-hydroxy-phenyl)propionate hydroxylase/6-hydroxy-3-succinoylpyridine 3-monooxygenase
VTDSSVVVVGAGTVGLVTALGLARNGVDVAVVERETAVASGPRDMIYHWSILPTLADLGILEPMLQAGLSCDRLTMRVLATGETLHLDMGALGDITSTPFNLHLPQRQMTDVLMAALAQWPHATVERGVEVREISQDPDGVTIRADAAGESREYRSRWVVGADGSHSVVRHAAGLSLAGTTWPERMVSADLRFDLSTLGHSCGSTQLDPEYGATIAKVDASGLWRYTIAESRMLPEEQIEERALEAIRHALPEGADPGLVRISGYRIHQRAADRFRIGRALLVGDAAHLTTPSLALGMLSGLCDAKLLVEGLSAVILDRTGDEVLDEYSTRRRRNFRDVTSPRSSERMELLFSPGSAAQLEARVAVYRETAASRDKTRKFFHADGDCESPALFAAHEARSS